MRCIFYKGKVCKTNTVIANFLHGNNLNVIQKYDEKVDLWSIGALLYKVIVGQCGFYAVSVNYSNMVISIYSNMVVVTVFPTMSVFCILTCHSLIAIIVYH